MNETESTVGEWKPARSVQLPAGWRWTTIGDVATDTQIGIVRSKAQQNREGQGVPYLKMNNLTMSGKVITNNIVFVQATQDEINRYALRKGDILFNTRNSIELVGKTGIVTQGASGFIYNNNLMRIRTKPNVLPLFIAYQMCSPDFRNRMERVKRSTTNVAALYAKDVLPLPIALAPVDQQSFIVAEIEKQFSRLDEAVANLKRVKANLKRYKAAVLKAAVEGKLTEEWRKAHPDVEPASELLKRILAERRAKWNGKGKYKEPDPLEVYDLPELPARWVWATALQVVDEVKDGTHDTPKYQKSGIPFITQKHIKPSGLVFDDYKLISEADHEQFYKRSNPERGDILVSMIGVNRGQSCIINTDAIFSIKNVGLFKPNHSLTNSKFMHLYFSSVLGQRLILRTSKGGAQPFIGLTELRAWPLLLLPLAEQNEIVSEVERRFSVIEELENQVAADLQRAERFRQSIMHRAFEGKLVSSERAERSRMNHVPFAVGSAAIYESGK